MASAAAPQSVCSFWRMTGTVRTATQPAVLSNSCGSKAVDAPKEEQPAAPRRAMAVIILPLRRPHGSILNSVLQISWRIYDATPKELLPHGIVAGQKESLK